MSDRDTSAFTTLDNANEGIMSNVLESFRKEFAGEKTTYRDRQFYTYGYQARQPEIDALKEEKLHLRTTLDEAFRTGDSLVAEIHALKAENERLKVLHDSLAEENRRLWLKCQDALVEVMRLRKDAERYRWLRDPKVDIALVIDKVVSEIPSEEGTGYDGLKVYEYRAGEELDEALDAAMKDFSTKDTK